MSGDVQPRKRKDKRKKKEGGSLGMIHEPVTSLKFRSESEDPKVFDLSEQGEKIHIQNEYGMGGNICVKIIFFCLLGLLVGVVGLIYMKSQGSSDVDLPNLEESRFADYFTGWLDDNTEEPEQEIIKTEIYHDHSHDENDELDHEEVEADEEDGNKEEDQNVEQDGIYKIFGVENSESEEAHKSSMTLNKVTESEELEAEREVNEDENEDEIEESDEIKKEKKDKDGINETYNSEELEEKDDSKDDNNDISKENIAEDHVNKNDLLGFDEGEENRDSFKRKIYGMKKRIDIENNDDTEDENAADAENDDSDDNSSNGKEDSDTDVLEEGCGENEEDKQRENFNEDDDLSYEVMDLSNDVLDGPEGLIDDSIEETEKSFIEEGKSKDLESEFMKEEEEAAIDTGGVAIKLGVGIALIIIAHLVLVQKWKSVSKAASDEKSAFVSETGKEKSEMGNLHSSIEHVITRRQTLLPQTVFVSDEWNENDLEREGEEEEEYTINDKEEKFGKYGFKKINTNNWDSFEESVWNVKLHENKNEVKADLTANKDNEEEIEEDKGGEDEENEEDEEDEDEEDEEDEDEEDEGKDEQDKEDEEENNEEDDEDDEEDEEEEELEGDDDYKEEVLNQDVEELSSQEELTEPTPIPSPMLPRGRRGAQDVDEDPIKHFEESGEVEEGPQVSLKDEMTGSQYSQVESKKPPPQEVQNDDWSYKQELEFGDEQFENNPKAAVEAYERVISKKPTLIRALIGRARALDHWAEKEKSNAYLRQAIDAYKSLLLNNGNLLDDETYLKLAERCIERMRFAGALISAIEVHKALIMKYPNTPKYRNMLAVTYLMMNKIPQARVLLEETLSLWPDDGFALVHYGFILKTNDDNMKEGAEKLMAGIQTKEEGVINGMFFFHLGDALHRLGRGKEAMEWYELGVKEGLFLSQYQRSLYNVNRLKGQPWWTKEDTTYRDFFEKLESNWREIRREGLELLNSKGGNLFKEETENLKDTGDWKQLDLYFRGKKTAGCNKAPITCSLVSSFQPAATCTRGQIKFSVMLPNTHVWPHCGPTNCRLRSHLGLVVPKHTFIRVAEETRTWEEGKFIIFDDSFEHEVWHNGTGPRLVLIVDVWHPELTNHERRQLSPI